MSQKIIFYNYSTINNISFHFNLKSIKSQNKSRFIIYIQEWKRNVF